MTLGRVDDFDRSRVDDIVSALSGYTDKLEVLDAVDDCHHEWSKNYGDVYVLEKLFNELKLDKIIDYQLQNHEYEFDVNSAVKAMVFNRGKKIQKDKKWFGYKLHLIVDAAYELPVAYKITPASGDRKSTRLNSSH